MKIRFEPPRITLLDREAVTELIRYLVKLSEKLNIAFDGMPGASEFDEIKNEISNNRVYIRMLCQKNGIVPPDEVSWKK